MLSETGSEMWRRQALSFDAVAHAYERYRPAYPDAVIEKIAETAALQAGARLLEVGCGTGKATRLFAQRGFRIHALDPGASLIAQAAQSMAATDGVSFETTRFEEWRRDRSSFDLVFSAQAFHWVEKPKGFALAAEALKAGGWLALFWTARAESDAPIFSALDDIYMEFAPGIAKAPKWSAQVDEHEDEIAASGYFEAPQVCSFPWLQRYHMQEYIGLLGTYSDHIALPAVQREALFTAISTLIDADGGFIDIPCRTVVYLARKAS